MQSQLEDYLNQISQSNTPLTESDYKIKKLCKQIINKIPNEKMTCKTKCYFCNGKIKLRHSFYNRMCVKCGTINITKRNTIQDLNGKIAVVTGGRIKIGYYTALRLLQCGAKVIITTRFASDALSRYRLEPDYDRWKSNLVIYQVDFMCFNDVQKFTHSLKSNYTHIDYLINNAAQTLERPRQFYKNIECMESLMLENEKETNSTKIYKYTQHPILITNENKNTLHHNIESTQIDEHGQLLDLRPINSWVKSIEQVSVSELSTVMIINSIVPFFLVQELTPLLKCKKNYSCGTYPDKVSYIINVSSMEGKFNRSKTHHHPHTNMAKASLNMMTRTIGKNMRKTHRICVLSVDTGWNTIEEPCSYDKVAPLDCKDGMARILDPIFTHLNRSGIFLKNFIETEW